MLFYLELGYVVREGPTHTRSHALPLMNIPRIKNSQHENCKYHMAKVIMGLEMEVGGHDIENVSTESNFAQFCDFQTAFMWLLRAR